MSYRWLKNGEPVEGGTNGTLTVAWSKGESTDVYQAIACYVIDGYVAESKVSAELAVRNLPTGAVILIK